MKCLLLTIGIEKSLDYVNHSYLLTVLESYCLNQNVLKWISILLQNQEPRVINGDKTTREFLLKNCTRQGDPISAFFILVLEIDFIFIKKSKALKVCQYLISSSFTLPAQMTLLFLLIKKNCNGAFCVITMC